MLPQIDYRIQEPPHSTVEQEDNTRKEVFNKLIHQIEMHPDREALKADLKKNQAYNAFSEISKNMIHSMESGVLRNVLVLKLNSEGPNSPMKRREDNTDAVKIKDRLDRESGGANPKIHPSKQVRHRATQPFLRSSRKPDGYGILLPPHQVPPRHGGNQQINGGRHRARMNSDLKKKNSSCKVFRLQAMAIPL